MILHGFRNLSRFLVVLFVLLIGTTVFPQTFKTTLEDSTFSEMWIGTKSIDSGYSHSGTHYALTDSLNPYGLGVEMLFPEEKRGKNTLLEIEGWVKSDKANAYSIFVFSIEKQGKTVFWKGIPLSPLLAEKSKWFRFYDSVPIPANLTSSGKIKAFLWNAGRKQKIGIDDLSISFREKESKSFFPEFNSTDYSQRTYPEKLLFSNDYYSVLYQQYKNQLMIRGRGEEQIINDFRYFLDYFSTVGNKHELEKLEFAGSKQKNGITVLKFTGKTLVNKMKLEVICREASPEIGFNVSEKYTKTCTVSRSAILLDAFAGSSEIYRFNRKSDKDNFQNEYWLDKEGIKLGDSK